MLRFVHVTLLRPVLNICLAKLQEADKIRQHLGKKTEKEKKAALMCLRRKVG